MRSPGFHRSIAVALCVSAVAACAGGGSGRGSAQDDDVITTEELEQASAQDLYGVIDQIRPRWLRARQERTFVSETPVAVFVDGVRRGNADTLRSIRTVSVAEVRFLNARDATTMYGTDMAGGAILVIMRR